jgi:myo-inositol-1(or 4)-monophosphatase
MQQVSGIRRTGSAALDLAWVAAGRFDSYWERGIKPWDMAAGILMVREAGGMVTDMDGENNMMNKGHLLASNLTIHKAMLQTLKS